MSYKIALGGIVSALSLVIMCLTGILPALYIVLPMLCGLLIKMLAEEVSVGWAFLTYISVSLLSFFLNPNIEATFIFILFFGIYPVISKWLNKTPVFFRLPIKWIYYFSASFVNYRISVFLVGVDESVKNLPFGEYWEQIFVIIIAVFFSVYDFYISLFLKIYQEKWRKKIFR
ncbi:MAG: hypothetical protein LBM93_12160 [Oscillospiraceae bacterium]|jgi:hypothetical protein|nr:hypothetical protein [Oscillospiraceae bacterium]